MVAGGILGRLGTVLGEAVAAGMRASFLEGTGLMAGAARQLASGGRLVTYGPYFETDQPAAPGNLAFDESLRARDPAWGIRQLDDVAAQAERHGLALQQRHAMPANNLLLVFAAAAS